MSCVSVVPAIPAPAIPAVSQSLVDSLARKYLRREVSEVPELWRRLVIKELTWCCNHIDELSYRHRLNACELVDWYHRNYGITPYGCLKLYPSESEMYRRQTIAELDWASQHVNELSRRQRNMLIDMASDCLQILGVYHSWWSSLNW